MTLAIILIVLLIDRLLWQGDPLRRHLWFDRYTDWLLSLATGQWLAKHRLGALWLLLPPLALVALLQLIAGFTAGLVIGTVILLFALGPVDLGRDVQAYRQAKRRGDEEAANRRAAALAGEPVPDTEPARSLAVARGLIAESLPRLFGPLFWFIVLGPLGAALYRLAVMANERSSLHGKAPGGFAASAQRLVALLDWLPARAGAAAFAAAGDFDGVRRAWAGHQGDGLDPGDARRLMDTAGEAALHSWPDDEEIAAGEDAPVVDDALSLVWRSLAVWLIALLILTLFASLP